MNNDNKRRNLNKKSSDNMVIKIAMIILGLLLVFVLTLYAVDIFTQGKKIDTNKETQKETISETSSEKETQKETVKETESEKETQRETVKETKDEKETLKETQAEQTKDEQTKDEQTKDEQAQAEEEPTEPSQIPVPEYTPTVNISIDTIRNASQSELVDMIIRGELGYGAERLDLLQKAGKDYYFYNDLVNKRLKELGF